MEEAGERRGDKNELNKDTDRGGGRFVLLRLIVYLEEFHRNTDTSFIVNALTMKQK